MKKIVISAIGKDRPGIAAGVTEALFLAGCNLEDTAMTILEGEFAILLIASLPTKMPMAAFEHRVQQLAKKMKLVLSIKKMEVNPGAKIAGLPRTAIITASGSDQTGILYRLSGILARNKVNITDLSSRQIPGPKKTTLYTVMIETTLPRGFSLDRLRQELQAAAQAMGLDIQVREIRVEEL